MAPIRTESALWGYISIAECTHELGLLDLSAVEAAANAVALIVWKKRALEQRTREQTRFIGDLLFGDQDSESLASRALLLGYEPSERHTAVVLEWRHGGGDVRPPHVGGRRHEVARAAETLIVHLNTVKYRLKRVHELTGHDPYEPGTTLDFQVALLIRRLDNQVGR